MKISFEPDEGAFPRIQIAHEFHRSSEEMIQAYIEYAVEQADEKEVPVHIIDTSGFTFFIVYPEPTLCTNP